MAKLQLILSTKYCINLFVKRLNIFEMKNIRKITKKINNSFIMFGVEKSFVLENAQKTIRNIH